MKINGREFIVFALVLLLSTVLESHSQTSDRVELFRHPGLLWLSWSAAERENFVYGFIQGHGHGVVEACRGADDLFEKDKPHQLGHDDVPRTFPSARCRARVAEYSNVKIDLAKGPDFRAYTTVITEFYTRHPEYRDTPISLLMDSLSGTKRLTADELYRKWTTSNSGEPQKDKP